LWRGRAAARSGREPHRGWAQGAGAIAADLLAWLSSCRWLRRACQLLQQTVALHGDPILVAFDLAALRFEVQMLDAKDVGVRLGAALAGAHQLQRLTVPRVGK